MKLRSIALAASLAAVVGSAHAGIINVQANTAGSSFTFAPGSQTDLAFNIGGFNKLVSDAGLRQGLSNLDLGSFTLGSTNGNYNGTFSLMVNFTVPATSPASGTFAATLTGTVSSNVLGGVDILFDDDADANTNSVKKTFTYTGGSNGTHGFITLDLNRLYTVGPSSTNNLGGGITVTAVPAPSALAAFGIGALGAIRRKRRNR